MSNNAILSNESARLLSEIIDNESTPDYWRDRFENLSTREDSILRGCFKELKDAGMIAVMWADDYPYFIQVLKDGYLYEQHMSDSVPQISASMTRFEQQLYSLLERTKSIKRPINSAPIGTSIAEHNRPSQEWINDVQIFHGRYLKDHPLYQRMNTILFHRNIDAYNDLVSCLTSVSKDQEFIDKMRGLEMKTIPAYQAKSDLEFDVFISHANKDKDDIVEKLYTSLDMLGVKIFYDKRTLAWGDKWKDRILDGTRKAEFAIIVISENFFDREWTEKELSEFLNRQNKNGQKLILPIVHNITTEDLRRKYPQVSDIQAIDSKDYTCDQIALLFANELIKRLKDQG